MGNAHAKHALNDIPHNEKNLCCLFLLVKKSGAVARAFAEIYILLNQLTGLTVREYCREKLGYNRDKFYKIFSTDEINKISGAFNPKTLDVTLLYKLLFHVCGLSQDHQNWINFDPAYELEFHLHRAKNARNDTMHERSELTDEELLIALQDLEDDVCDAIMSAGNKSSRDTTTLSNTFRIEMQKYRPKKDSPKKNLFQLLKESFHTATGSIGIPTGSFGFGGSFGSASSLLEVASASSEPMAAGTSQFGSVSTPSGFNNLEADELGSFDSTYADEFGYSKEVGREELLKLLDEAEESECRGVCLIIRRQLDLLNG